MFVKCIANDMPHPLNGDEELVDGVEVVAVALVVHQVLDFPEGTVELADLGLVEILETKLAAQSPEAIADVLHPLLERAINMGVLLELADGLDKAVLHLPKLLVGMAEPLL